MERFKNVEFNTPRSKCCGHLLESPRRGDSNKCSQDLFLGIKRLFIIFKLALLEFSLQQQIVYNFKMLGNKHCRYKEGPLYLTYTTISSVNFAHVEVIHAYDLLI